jgi:hypothetical protein
MMIVHDVCYESHPMNKTVSSQLYDFYLDKFIFNHNYTPLWTEYLGERGDKQIGSGIRRSSIPAASFYPLCLLYGVWSCLILVLWNIKKKQCAETCLFIPPVLFECTSILQRARSSVVGWGTVLQAGRARVQFQMRSLDFSIDLISPAAIWRWGRLGL